MQCQARPGASYQTSAGRHTRTAPCSAWRPTSSGVHRATIRAQAAARDAVVITGASSGIGKSTALLLAKQGWHVFAGVRKDADGQALQDLLRKELSPARSAAPDADVDGPPALSNPGLITPVIIDVTKPDTIAQAADQVRTTLEDAAGPGGAANRRMLTGLVNNAGKVTLAPLEHMPIDVFEDHLQVNLTGALRVTQALLPLLRPPAGAPLPPRTARIINISSQSGTVAFPMFGGYCASKFGLEALNDCLKYELDGQGIDVICVKPGPIKSDIWTRAKGTSTQVLSGLPPEAITRYGDLIDKITRATRKAEDSGASCDELAALIATALTTPNPRDRYLFGQSATVQMVLRRLLPDRWWNPLVMNNLKKL